MEETSPASMPRIYPKRVGPWMLGLGTNGMSRAESGARVACVTGRVPHCGSLASAQDLTAPQLELYFGEDRRDGKVFVNGQQSVSRRPAFASSYDVKERSCIRERIRCVAIANYGPAAA